MQTLEQISMACLRKTCNQLYFSASGQPYFIYIATQWFSILKGRVKKKLHHSFSYLSPNQSMLWYVSNHSISSKSYLSYLTVKVVGFSYSHAWLALSIFGKKKAILLIRIILSKLASTFERNFCATFENECHNNNQRTITYIFLFKLNSSLHNQTKVPLNTMEVPI